MSLKLARVVVSSLYQLAIICIEQMAVGNALILATGRRAAIVENSKNQNQVHLCRRCGRKLKSEESKSRGMGESCYKKWIAEHGHKKLFNLKQSGGNLK